MYRRVLLYLVFALLFSCNGDHSTVVTDAAVVSIPDTVLLKDTIVAVDTGGTGIKTGATDPSAVIAFARTLKGVPYRYGSSDPAAGFDCSGFITYVFNHFGIVVPRSSVDFTDEGVAVELPLARPGDLILFTGTDNTISTVGHMGIITNSNDSIIFIHSSSGKAHGVTETTLNPYYMGRFVKVIRIFHKNT